MKTYVVIAGSREFDNYEFLRREVDYVLKENNLTYDMIVIVSGGAKGADKLGERYAMDNGIDLDLHPADWSKGKAVGMIRNREMANISQIAVIFWDGKSPGSKGMNDICIEKKIKTYLYNMPTTVIGRLEKAKVFIEKAVKESDLDNLLKYSKNFKDLYAECFSMWADNSFNNILEYSEAEYLKYIILYSFGQMFDYNNSLHSLKVIASNNAKDCNIVSVL